MQILTSFEALDLEEIIVERGVKEKDVIREICTMIDQRVKVRLDTAGATVLKGPTPQFVFGGQDPARIIKIAKGWNQEISELFTNALMGMVVAHNYVGQVPADKALSHALIDATKEACDDWWPAAKHGHALEKEYRFHCILSDDELEDICQHPEKYLVVSMDTACRY